MTAKAFPPITYPLCERIAAKLVNVSADKVLKAFNTFPKFDPIEHWVWIGAGAAQNQPLIMHGKNIPVARFLYNVMGGEPLATTWNVRRWCAIQNCVYPGHHELKPHNINRTGRAADLPLFFQHRVSSEDADVQDLLEEFQDKEFLKLPSLLSEYGTVFSESAIRRALDLETTRRKSVD